MKITKSDLKSKRQKYLVSLFMASGVLLLIVGLGWLWHHSQTTPPAGQSGSTETAQENYLMPQVENDQIVAATSSSRIQFADRTNIRIKTGETQTAFSLVEASAQPKIENGKVVSYSEVYPGVDVHYLSTASRLKEDIIVKERTARREFAYDFQLPSGAALRPDQKGGVQIVKDKQILFYLEPLKVSDQSGRNFSYEYVLPNKASSTARIGLRPVISTELDSASYPLTIDPTIDWNLISVSPNIGSTAGGQAVTVSGTNFKISGFGNGADGSVTLAANKNINTDSIAAGRTCADAANYSVIGLNANSATLATTTAGCLAAGDEVLLINLQGTASSTVNVGNYETVRVSAVNDNVVTFSDNKAKYYGQGSSDDTNIGVDAASQKVMLQRVPNYNNVTINSGVTLTASPWDGLKGGVLYFKALGTVSNSGSINMSGRGYRGGATGYAAYGYQGESFNGLGAYQNINNNYGGGGGGSVTGCHVAAGGGGSYGAAGACGSAGYFSCSGLGEGTANCTANCGRGGVAYGTAALTQLYFGSGGGGGAHNISGTNGYGGNGGGIIIVKASNISNSGTMVSAGAPGYNGDNKVNYGTYTDSGAGGGGGAGGSVYLIGQSLALGSSLVTAAGGAGGANYYYTKTTVYAGAGSVGRLAINYVSSQSGTTAPVASIAQIPASPSSALNFGSTPATQVQVINSQTITALTPAHAAGAVDISVVNPDNQTATLTQAYTYINPPTVTSLTPSAVSGDGGDTVTISGANFYGTPNVSFGGNVASQVTVVSSSTLSVVVPPSLTVGVLDVVITNPDGQSVTLANGVSYISSAISSVSPASGPAKGGQAITIAGRGFKVGGFSNGADGSVTVAADKNINADPIANGRTCADAANYSVVSLNSTGATLATSSAGCLAAGDEVLLINLQGTAASAVNVGNYETISLAAVNGTNVIFATAKTKHYGQGSSDDTNIGVDAASQKVMLQRVPNYNNVTINSGVTLTASPWDGLKGGVLYFKALGTVSNSGSLNMSGKGYRGGLSYSGYGYQGESFNGLGAYQAVSNNSGGGGAGIGSACHIAAGGGGSYGADGACGSAGYFSCSGSGDGSANCTVNCGRGGAAYGTSTLAQLYFGSGGGGGAHNISGSDGNGGNGGGIILIQAGNINNAGTMVSAGVKGVDGDYKVNYGSYTDSGAGGGGGAGGSIYLIGQDLALGSSSITAAGGAGGANYYYTTTVYAGAGSVGRLAVNYVSSQSGTTAPVANVSQISANQPSTLNFGGAPATQVQVINSQTITALTPAHTAGKVDISVVNPDSQTATLTQAYTYIDAPTVTAATPSTVSGVGGDTVTISGANFYGTPSVLFGGATSSSVTLVSSTTLSVVAPTHTEGIYDMVVINPDGQSATLSNGIHYAAMPAILSVTPAYGSLAGGADVTISGSNFSGGNSGSGKDGSITIAADKNINTDAIASDRTCADAVNYSLTSLSTTTATLATTPANGCLAAGDEILLVNLQGTASSTVNVGNHETIKIKSVVDNVITFSNNKVQYYGDKINDDTNIGVAATNQKVMLQRVPNYNDVAINASSTLTASAWDGNKGGVLFFRAQGTVTNNGSIDMTGKGYRGATVGGSGLEKKGGYSALGGGNGSNSTNVTGCPASSSNIGGAGAGTGGGAAGATRGTVGSSGGIGKGGGAGWCSWTNCGHGGAGGEGGGGGGSTDSWTNPSGGGGGAAYFPDKNSQSASSLVLGAGATAGAGGGGTGGINGPTCSGVATGGGGGKANGQGGALGTGPNGSGTAGGNGGAGNAGGGIILISANNIVTATSSYIRANGGNGGVGGSGASTYGGGGQGGSGGQGGVISLSAKQVSLNDNSVLANGGNGGNGGTASGAGGTGATFSNGADLGGGGGGGQSNTYNGGGGGGAGGRSGYGGSVNVQYVDSFSGTTAPAATVVQAQNNDSVTVLFGDTPAANVRVVDASTIIATLPAHAAGTVDVSFVDQKGYKSTLANSFDYKLFPRIDSLSPTSAAKAGGDTVTISGANFYGAPTVMFGEAASPSVTVVNSSTLSVIVPASLTIGSPDVVVINQDGQSATAASGFTYLDASPSVVNVASSTGPTAGGQTITITGSNFKVGGFGTGNDGSVSVAADKNINTDTIASGRSCADAANYSIVNLRTSGATLAASASGCLAAGDEVLLINLQGTASSTVNVGNYETLSIASVDGANVVFATVKTKHYGQGSSDDTNIGVATTSQKVMLQRVPNYNNVTINSGVTLTASPWDGLKGGVLYFKAFGTVINSGTISMSGKGYRGGALLAGYGYQGESFNGSGAYKNVSNNLGAGGAGLVSNCHVGTGGGGSYAVAGSCGSAGYGPDSGLGTGTANCTANCGRGGATYGTSTLAQLYFGSGGGGGSYNVSGTNGYGGNGGGIILIKAGSFNNSGNLVSGGNNGQDGDYQTNRGSYVDNGAGGGGGAGGSIYLAGKDVSLGTSTITAAGGTGGVNYYQATNYGGTGSVGRLAVDYISTVNGTTTPVAKVAKVAASPSSIVNFGGTPATQVQVISIQTITAVVPAHVSGKVDVSVVNPDSQTATLTQAYTYLDAPIIAAVTPSSVSAVGGDTVTISGSNFYGTPSVLFGGATSSSVTLVSSTTLSVVIPTHTEGTFDVVVVNPDGQSATLANGLRFLGSLPSISTVTPNQGPVSGGTSVTIFGSNFQADYSRPITITNSSTSTLTDYQVAITIDTQSLIAQGKLKADGSNLRLIGSDKATVLPYWIEVNTLNTASTKIWTKLSSLPVGDTVIYLHYGDPSLTSQSNGSQVFRFYDDFPGTTIDSTKWDHTSNQCSSSNSGNAMYLSCPGHGDNNNYNESYALKQNYGDTKVVEYTFTPLASQSQAAVRNMMVSINGVYYFQLHHSSNASLNGWSMSNVSANGQQVVQNQSYKVKLVSTPTYYAMYVDGAKIAEYTATSSATLSPLSLSVADGWGWLVATTKFDDVRIRAYSAVEPTIAVGNETSPVTFDGLAPSSLQLVSSSTITATVPAHVAGAVDISVANWSGQSATLSQAYTYVQAPQPATSTPDRAAQNAYVSGAVIRGNYFQSGATVVLRASGDTDIACQNESFIDSQTITCDFDLSGHNYGGHDIVVTNPDGQSGILANALAVLKTPPTLSSVVPDHGLTSSPTAVTLSGLYLDNFYKIPVTVTNAATSTLNDYQLSFTFNSAALISAGKMRSDGGDIRFFDTDGNSPLSYWLEGPMNSAATKVWVRVPKVPVGSKTIYLAYGNTALTSSSNATSTFSKVVSGVVGSWNFNEGSGNTAYDASGNGTNLGVYNLVSWQPGHFGSSVQMSPSISAGCTNQGAGVYTASLSSAITNLPQSQFTLAYWNKVPVGASGTTRVHLATNVSVTSCGNCTLFGVYDHVSIRNTASPDSGSNDLYFTAPTDGAWHHYAFIFDRTNLAVKMYIDGVLASSKSIAAADYGTIQWIGVGVYKPECSDSIPGESFDDMRIYKRVLTPEEIGVEANQPGYVSANSGGQELFMTDYTATAPSVSLGTESGASTITFDGQAATGFQMLSSSTASVIPPAHVSGTVDVTWTNLDGQSASLPHSYTYYPDKYSIITPALNLREGQAGTVTVQAQDMNGNVLAVATDTVLALSSSAATGFFARDLNEGQETGWNYTSVIIPSGQSSVTFYYKDNAKGSPVLTATPPVTQGSLAATQTEKITSRFRFLVTGVTNPVKAGVPSSVTIQAIDYNNQPLTDYAGTVHFTTNDLMGQVPADFTLKPTMLGSYTFVNGISFSTQGGWCVSVADTKDSDISGSQCSIMATTPNTGTPTHLKIITDPQYIAADGVSAPITVQLQDVDNNPASFATSTSIYIYSDSTSTKFSLDGTSFSSAPLATVVPAGLTSINIYLQDQAIGAHNITVADDDVSGRDFGLTNDSQSETTGVGAAYRYVAMPLIATSTAGQASGFLTIGLQDSLGNTVSATLNQKAVVLPSSGLVATSTDGQWSGKLPLNFTVGQSTVGFYYKQTAAGTFPIVISDTDPANGADGLADAVIQLTVKPAAATKIAFATAEQEIVAGQVSNPFSLRLLDTYDNPAPAASDTRVYLTTNQAGSHFSNSEAFAAETQSVVIPATASSTTFYFKQAKYVSGVTLTASDNAAGPDGEAGLADASQIESITPGALARFIFDAAPSNAVAGTSSAPFILSAQNSYNVAIPFSAMRLYLRSASLGTAAFATSSDFTWPVTYLDLAAGATSTQFYYEDNKAANVGIVASDEANGTDTGIVNAQATMTILPAAPDHLSFVSAAQSLLAGQVSAPATVSLEDRFQNQAIASSDITLNLTTSATSGTFSSSVSGPFTLSNLVIPSGSGTADFYYRDVASGTPLLIATASSLGSSSQTENIAWGAGQTISLQAATTTLAVGTTSEPIMISVKNQYGVAVPLAAEWNFALAAQPASSSVINKLDQSSFTYLNTLAGTSTITAAQSGLATGTLAINLKAAAASQLTFVNQPRLIEIGQKSATLSVEAHDQYGNIAPLADNLSVNLSSDSLMGHFLDSSQATITSLTLPASKPHADFFYTDTTTGTSTLSVSSGSLNGSQAINVINGSVRRLRLSTTPTILAPGVTSGLVKLETLNAYGQSVPTAGDLVVSLSAADGHGAFSSATSGPFTLESLPVPAGQSSASFYFRDELSGAVNIVGSLAKEQIVTVTNSNDYDLHDYTVAITVDTQSLIAAGSLQSDGRDLRFTDADGKTNIPYWIESGLNTTVTRIWLRLPELSRNSDRLVYMSYGEAGRSAASSQSAVFPYSSYYDNFSGWSTNTSSICGTIGMLGGYNIFGQGASVQKTYANMPAGRYEINFNYYHIDSWDGEAGRLFVNGQLAWQRHYTYSGNNYCGGAFGDGGLFFPPVSVTVDHPGGDLTLRFDSTLDQAATDESWGINNVTIRPVADIEATSTVSAEAAQLGLTITAGAPYRIAVSGPQSMSADNPSTAYTAQILDQYGNATTFAEATAVDFTTSASTTGQFATSTSGTWGIKALSLVPGVSSFNFYYQDIAAGTKTLGVSAGSILPASSIIEVKPGAITHLAFASVPQSFSVQATSSAFVIQTLDKNNNLVVPASALTLNLTTTSGHGAFSTSSEPWKELTSFAWPAAADMASFYYKDSQPGTSTITVADSQAAYPAIKQDVKIISDRLSGLKFASAAQTIVTATPSAPVTVALLDGSGNLVASDTPVTITLSSNSGTTEFSASLVSPSWQPTLNLTVAAGETSANFYFRDSAAGTINISAAVSGLASVTQAATVIVGNPDHLALSVASSTPAGVSIPVTVRIMTADGLPIALAGTTNINLSSSPAGAFSLSDNSWQPVTSFAWPAGQAEQTLYFRGQIAGTSELKVSAKPDYSWADGAASLEIQPLNIYQIKVLSGPDTFNVHQASTAFVAQAQDQYGNVTSLTASDTANQDSLPIYLYGAGQFATSTAGTWGIKSVPLAIGENTFSFYYKSQALGEQAITVSETADGPVADSGWIDGHWTLKVIGDSAANLNFSTPSRTIKAGEYGEITVAATLGDGSPAILENNLPLVLSSSGTTGSFTLSTTSPSAVTTINIPRGQSSVTFYVLNPQVGGYTLNAAAAGYQPLSQALTVVGGPAAKASIVSAPQTIAAGQDSQAFHLQIQDAYGNLAALDQPVSFKLQATDGGVFSLDSGASWSETSTLSVAAQVNDAYFYYRNKTAAGIYQISASDQDNHLSPASQNVTVSAAAVKRLAIASSAFSIVKGQVSPEISVLFYDGYGNSKVLASAQDFYLYTDDQGSFSLTSDFAATTSRLTVPAGAGGFNFYYQKRVSGAAQITVSDYPFLDDPDQGLTNAIQVENISAGLPTSWSLASLPASAAAGSAVPFSIQINNQYGLPVAATSSITVYLNTSSLYGRFSTSTDFGPANYITSLNLAAGQTAQTVYYRDTAAGTATLSLADAHPAEDPDTGLKNNQHALALLPADLYALVFLNAPQSLEAGQPSNVMAIEARDSYGNVKSLPSDLPLYFYSSSASSSFATSSDYSATTTSSAILAGATGLSFYYKDLVAGTPRITVSDQPALDDPDLGYLNAIQSETITAGDIFRIALLTNPQSLESGQVSAPYAVQLQNRYGAPRPVNNETTLYLTSSSNLGQFSIYQSGPYNITSLKIPAGQSQSNFYYRQLGSGSAALRVSDASPADGAVGWLDATQDVAVTYGAATQIVVAASPSQVTARHISNAINVALLNDSGYQTSATSTLRLYVRSSAAEGNYEFAAAPQGPWGINFVDLPANTSQFSLYYRSSQLGAQTLQIGDELPLADNVGLVDAAASIQVLEQKVDHFLVTNISDPQIQGSPSTLIVMARDASDFIYPQYQGHVCFTSSDAFALLPACYDFTPSDNGLISLGNSVAFYHSGEKTVYATDANGITGMQNNITVKDNQSGTLSKLRFTNVSDHIALQRGQAYGPITVQLFDDNDQPVNAPDGGYPIRLSSASAGGRFALDVNGSWSESLVATIPAGLNSLNVYYQDSSSGSALVMASDWYGGVDDASIANASLTAVSSGLVISVNKKLSSPNAANLALTENKSLFINDSLLDSISGEGIFNIQVADDSTGFGLPVSLSLSLKNAAGQTYSEALASSTASGTYTYNAPTIRANVPTDSGDWRLVVKAQSTDGRVGQTEIPITVSGWRGALDYSLGYVQQGNPLTIGATFYNNGVLSDPPDFQIQWLDKSGHAVASSTPLLKSQMTRFQAGEYYGNLGTDNGLVEGQKYHAFLVVNDTDDSILAEDSHGDIQISNNPALAPANFHVEKILTSAPPAAETYDLKFSWDQSDRATSYALYRTQDKFSRLFANPCTIAQVQAGGRASGTCETLIDMDDSPSDDSAHWVKEAYLPFGNMTSYTIKDAQKLSGDNYFFLVRASNGVEESGLSSLIFVSRHPFAYNSSAGATNYNWFSMPYSVTYFTNAAAGLVQAVLDKPSLIVQDIEGSLGSGASQKINAIALWDSLTQNIASVYRYRPKPFNKWTGVDFSILPGAGLYLQSSGIFNSFTWTILGGDKKITHDFTYNADSGATNYNWVSLPYSGMYRNASDIVKDIEGGIGADADQKINAIALWDSSSQNINSVYRYRAKPFNKWTGVDFNIKPGDGIYIQTSGLTTNFSWTPALLVEPKQ